MNMENKKRYKTYYKLMQKNNKMQVWKLQLLGLITGIRRQIMYEHNTEVHLCIHWLYIDYQLDAQIVIYS